MTRWPVVMDRGDGDESRRYEGEESSRTLIYLYPNANLWACAAYRVARSLKPGIGDRATPEAKSGGLFHHGRATARVNGDV